MRYAIPALLVLCLPLAAGDPDVLALAVAKFGSDYPEVRGAGTTETRAYLETRLAPLLAALESKDPEVSRRARCAIETLLPHHEVTKSTGAAGQQGQVIVFNQGGRRGRMVIRQVWINGKMQMRVENQHQVYDKLKKFGAEGVAAAETTLRMQLGLAEGRGFIVHKVVAGSAAARLGLLAHDIIVRIDDTSVMELTKVVKALGAKETWDGRRLRVFRRGKVIDLPAL